MTIDEFAHLLPVDDVPDAAWVVVRSAGDIRRLVARVRELEARVKELEEEANEPQVGTLRWVEREMAFEKAEKEAEVLAAAREIVSQKIRLYPAVDAADKLADAVEKLDGKEGT